MRSLRTRWAVVASLLLCPSAAYAQPEPAQPPPGDAAPAAAPSADLPVVQMQNSVDPGATSQAAAPAPASSGGFAGSSGGPSGAASVPATSDWTFEYHGYFRAPLRIGIGKRDNPAEGQSSTTFHVPVVPDDQYLSAQYTSANSRAWAELFFSYGNSWAKGTVALLGFNFTDAAWTDEASQFGIAQGYLTLTPDLPYENVRLQAKVGSFWSDYGKAGVYDAGKYDTYLFGRTHVMGETVHAEIDLGKFTLWGEQGFGAKRPDPSVYNNARFTMLHHEHGGLRYAKTIDVGLHYLYAWSQEEEREGATVLGLPDGSLQVVGADVHLDAGIAGNFYAGFSNVDADTARTVAPAIEVIHSFGGGEFTLGFVDNYLDGPTDASNGNGSVNTVLGQYELSLANILLNLEKPGSKFWGEGMDLTLTLFGMMNFVSSEDPDTDGTRKLKYGGELVWSALPWLGIGGRVDRVQPSSDVPEQSFAVISPRLFFRSQWVTKERIGIQYSRYVYNERVCPPESPTLCAQPAAAPVLPEGFGATTTNQDPGTRASPTTRPDLNVIKLEATMWW